MIQIEFENDKTINISNDSPNLTILDIANQNGIPFQQACASHGHCSTCRILVIENPENLTPRTANEQHIAEKKCFESNIRLACQVKVTGHVKVKQLVKDEVDVTVALNGNTLQYSTGRRQKIAIIYCDIKEFIGITSKSHPYDIMHILNRYFFAMSEVALRFNGYVESHLGSSSLYTAVGLYIKKTGETFSQNLKFQQDIARQAIDIGLAMVDKIEEINTYLHKNYNLTIQASLGIHINDAIIGDVGFEGNSKLQIIGDVVDVASKIQSACRLSHSKILISKDIYVLVNDEYYYNKKFQLSIKSQDEVMELYSVAGKIQGITQQEKIKIIYSVVSDNLSREKSPLFVRLLFHDVSDFDAKKNKGGLNASIRFPEQYEKPINTGLQPAILALYRWKSILKMVHSLEVSFADLIVVGAAVAIKKCLGPEINVTLGRKDAHSAQDAGSEKNIPSVKVRYGTLLKHFHNMGLTLRDMVVLSGAHTLGKADGVPFTEDLFCFSNRYFQRLLDKDSWKEPSLILLKTDKLLLKTRESRKYVQLYAKDQNAFFNDFSDAFLKLIKVGTTFN